MSFDAVISAIETQLQNNAVLGAYVDPSQISIGFKENLPAPSRYSIIIEPTDEAEGDRSTTYANFVYTIEIYARMHHGGLMRDLIKTGTNLGKGILDFVKDIKAAIRADIDFGLDSSGTSVSTPGASTSYTLGPNTRYLTVVVNGFRPTGYDEIAVVGALSSDTQVEGTVIAATLQTNIRALDDEANGFGQVTVTYDNVTRQFTITSAGLTGPESYIEVSAGATDSAHEVLGFANPTETRGVQIVDVTFGDVPDTGYEYYPIRYRIVPIQVTEEIYVEES